MANLVKFATGTLAQFAALTTKDPNTIYALTDARQLYKGDVLLGMSLVSGTDFLSTQNATANTVYVNSTTGEVKFFNGVSYVDVVAPKADTITDSTADSDLVSVGALRSYVLDQIQDMDVSAITDRIDDLETAVETTLPAAITAAQEGAQKYADAAVKDLADGAVAINTTAITALQTGKADVATTLAGYGIADAYTKNQTDSAIAAAVANADHLKREIVTSLPEASAADENTIYMVAKTGGSGDQQYDEFMLINGVFEKIGDSAVNLTGYATEEYVNTKVDALKGDSETKVDQALQDAKDYADSLADNYATAAQGAKADTALQKADITSGSANGTIAVKGTDVAVKGLGSAAYANTSAFDAAGAAATAAASAVNDAEDYTDSAIEAALTWQAIS